MTSSSIGTVTRPCAVRLEGRDSLAVLHRISTNALLDLTPGQARATLFCEFRGRLLHRAVVAAGSDGAVWLLHEDASGEALAAFVDKHVFREDVRILDQSGALAVTRVSAESAGVAMGEMDEHDGRPTYARVEEAFALVVSAAGVPLPADLTVSTERDRIDAGRAAHGREIVEAFTPFEVGLVQEVHLDKGCFTGQEALQRLVTYRSVRRRLVRVGGNGPPPDVHAEVLSGEMRAGVVTTALAEGSRWLGLAVLVRQLLDEGASFSLADTRAIDPPLAFTERSPQGRP